MRQRYVLYPGPIRCDKDNQSHYVSASALARLHGIEMRDCIVYDPDPANRTENYAKCIHLHPQCDEECSQSASMAVPSAHSTEAATQTR